MKEITEKQIIDKVSSSLFEATHILNEYTLNHLKEAYKTEDNKLSKEIISQLIENAKIAKEEEIPMCQDTGVVIAFVKLGRDVHLNCDLNESINKGIKEAYEKYYLRKSICDPLTRLNTKDNTPGIIYTEIVKGDNLEITLATKGAGSENMSKQKMLNPTDGIEGIKKFVIDAVKEADGRPCPPIFVGVGIGGDFEKSALLAKEAILREEKNVDEKIAKLEEEIKDELNKLNIGPMGLGGKTTCFEVFINTYPCHIASLPVAICIQCHANRHVKVVL